MKNVYSAQCLLTNSNQRFLGIKFQVVNSYPEFKLISFHY